MEPRIESDENLELMALIDRQYMETPFFGSRQMSSWLRRQGYAVGRKRIRRLMKLMGLHEVAPGPETSKKHPENRVWGWYRRLSGAKCLEFRVWHSFLCLERRWSCVLSVVGCLGGL